MTDLLAAVTLVDAGLLAQLSLGALAVVGDTRTAAAGGAALAAVLASPLVGVALLRLRRVFCGCDDLTIFEQPMGHSRIC